LPFRGGIPGIIFDGILNRAPAATAGLNPDLPLELDRIIDKCIEKERALRYQNASEIRTDLQRVKRDRDSGQGTARAELRAPGRWKWIAPAALVAGVLLASSDYYFHRLLVLTDKDTIVLADFNNKTGDSVFDETLR